MPPQGAFGVAIKIAVSTVLTAVVHVLDVDPIEFEKFIAEVTCHDSTDGYAEHIATGKRSFNEFALTVLWDRDEQTHQAVLAAFDSDEAVQMSIEDPEGIETITFNAIVTKMGRIFSQDDAYKCAVTIQPTGKPTITYDESA